VLEIAVVSVIAFVASGLTLYSGFGLGTVLLPAFALFFPAPIAVMSTAVVHLLTNILKAAIVRRSVSWPMALRFGLPAIPAAAAGAWVLGRLEHTPLFTWTIGHQTFRPTSAAVVIGLLMIVFAILEMQPWFQRIAAPPHLAPVGGLVTGFLGGISGHQGALRSMFLLKSGLDAAQFIATGVVIALAVDLSRLPVYLGDLQQSGTFSEPHVATMVTAATLSAFCGVLLASRHISKITISTVRTTTAALMVVIGIALIMGVIGS
jgi:uncharacterized protein